MKRNEERISHKYAKATYSKLGDQLTKELCGKLLPLAEKLETQRSVILLAQIVHRDDESVLALEKFFKEAGFGSLFGKLVSLLIGQRRLILLPRVLRALYGICLEDKGIMHFIIESPLELSQEEQDGFVAFLQKKTGKEIRYTLKSNPDLIAGVKMYSDTLGYEHSVQQKLYQL